MDRIFSCYTLQFKEWWASLFTWCWTSLLPCYCDTDSFELFSFPVTPQYKQLLASFFSGVGLVSCPVTAIRTVLDQCLLLLHTAVQTVVGQFLFLVLDQSLFLLLRHKQCWISLLSCYCDTNSVGPESCVTTLRHEQCWTSLLCYYTAT